MPATANRAFSTDDMMVVGGVVDEDGRKLYGTAEIIPEGLSIEQAMEHAGMNYNVIKRSVKDAETGREIQRFRMLTREDDPTCEWGMVTPRYQIAQNAPSFEVVEFMAQRGLHAVAGGTIDGGRKAWMLLELPETEQYAVAGDAITARALVWNTHDGSGSLAFANVPERLSCTNQLPFTIAGVPQSMKIRHTGDIDAKMAAASTALETTHEYLAEFVRMGEGLALKELSDRRLKKLLEELYPNGTTDRQKANAEERRETVRRLVNEAPNLEGHHGTAWAFVNAVAEVADWGSSRERDRIDRLTYNSPDTAIKNRALKMALSLN